MATFNQVILLGNLTRDPELKYTQSQTAVAQFGLASTRAWTGQDGSSKTETCFIEVASFGRLAENVNKFMHKGSPVLVVGHLTFEKWENRDDGQKHSRHKIVAEQVQFLSDGKRHREPGEDDPADDVPL